MRTQRTVLVCVVAVSMGVCSLAAGKERGPYALASVPHVPKAAKDIIAVGCEDIVPVQVPAVEGPSIFLNIQFQVTVPAGATSLIVYLYDPTDYNQNDFDVVVRYGQEVGFQEDPPGSGQGYPVYDWGSFSTAAYEECPIYNNDGSAIQAGDYYFAVLSNGGKPGGPVGMKACVDGAFFALADGKARAKTFEAYVDAATSDVGEQCVIDIPAAGVTDFLVTVEPAALGTEFALVVRPEGPIGLSTDGVAFDPSLPNTIIIDALGGYEEVCFTVIQGGFRLYLEAFGRSPTAEEAIITVRFNACTAELKTGDANCVDKIIPGIWYDSAAASNELPDAVQYRLTLTPDDITSCPGGELAVTIAQANIGPGEENADFLLYSNFGAPIPLRSDNGLPDFDQAPIVFQNATAGPGPETMVLKGDALKAGDYWFLVSRDAGSADAPPVYARLCAALTCGASFKRGHFNADASANIADVIAFLAYLFANGDEPACLDVGDMNDDGAVNIADAISFLAYLFASRPPPPAPFEVCGPDPTPDDVPCAATSVQCAGK